MNPHQTRALEILESLGNRPAAPFHEGGPASYLIEQATALGVDVRVDEFGNVIAHYEGGDLGIERVDPPIAYVAHMDHPGYEIVEVGERGTIARALGGVPVVSMKQSVAVLALFRTEAGFARNSSLLEDRCLTIQMIG